jgi:hypothetical protein
VAVCLLCVVPFVSGAVKAAAQTTTVCGNGSSSLLGDKNQYLFGGDQWNGDFTYVNQCLQITNSTAVPPGGPSSNYISGTFNDSEGAPADYPDFLYGCFHGTCTQNTNLPIQVSQFSKWSITSGETVVEPSGYNNDVAYDIWFDQGPTAPTNQNTTGTELMIWVQHNGSAEPIGSPTASFTDSRGYSWTVWVGTNTGNCGCTGSGDQVISFVNNNGYGATSGKTYSLNLVDFFQEALNLGQIQSSWYLTAIEFGTEIWVGGPGLQVNNFWVNVASATNSEGPYGGTPAAIPGTVMAENYDTGGQGLGYNVTSVNGSANTYRSDGVDLEAATAPAAGNDLGWSAAGQWFRYTANVASAGSYTVSFLVASPAAVTGAFHLSNASGTSLSGEVNVPATGGYQAWTTVTATVTLPAGKQTLTLNQDSAGWNIDSMAFATVSVPEGPYGGTPAAIPGTVMAENYDTGGQGVGYNVTSTNGSNNGYRNDGVDLELASSPATGNDLGWAAAAQWFRYTVNVATAGTYTVSFLVAAPAAVTDGFHLSNSSATSLSGNINIPATGGYQTWTTVTATVTLPAGTQTLTLNQDAGGWNIDSMAFALLSSGGFTTGVAYNIVNENSGSCVSATNSDTANGTTVEQYACSGGANSTETSQEWVFTNGTASGYYEVTNVNAPAEAWNVTGNGTANGSLIQLWTYAGNPNEEWEPVSLGNGYYKFVGQGSGLCLDTPAASTANSVQLQIYTCNGTAAQAFKFVTP